MSWIKTALDNKYIQCYPRNVFEEVTFNGEGRFGQVSSAEWYRTDRKVALKKLKNYSVNKLQSEVKMHSRSHSSKYIIRFLGLTKDESETSYSMVFEYADRNNLRVFLQNENDKSLQWLDKLKLSLDIAKGLDYIHSLNIAHRDLHSKNVVINRLHSCDKIEYVAKITDFGSAIVMGDEEHVDDISRVIGQIPFTDPKYLNDRKIYKKNLQSDIYSLGVIFWEISSHRIPFINYMTDSRGDFRELCLMLDIIGGKRERRVPRTPENYIKLYQDCWKYEEANRPKIDKVIEVLDGISPELTTSLETLNTG